MALSLTVIGSAAGIGNFKAQVMAALASTCTAILSEAGTTPDYVVRRKMAQKVQQNLDGYAAAFAVPVASQIQATKPTTYSDLTGIQDADVSNALSALWTQVAYTNILPS